MITVDSDAAGWGWFTDASTGSDRLFPNGNALAGSPAAGRIDLVSVLEHELGHALGLEHKDGGVMDASLAPGVRETAIEASQLLVAPRPAAISPLRGVPTVTRAAHSWLARRPPAVRRMHPSTRGGRS